MTPDDGFQTVTSRIQEWGVLKSNASLAYLNELRKNIRFSPIAIRDSDISISVRILS